MNMEEMLTEKLRLEQENDQLKATIGQLRTILQSHDALSDSTGTIFTQQVAASKKCFYLKWQGEFCSFYQAICFNMTTLHIQVVNMLN